MKKILILLIFGLSVRVTASFVLDEAYSYKRIAVAVVNLKDEPVYGDLIEKAMAEAIRRRARFEFSDSGYLRLKEWIRSSPVAILGKEGDEKIKAFDPILSELAAMRVNAAVLAEVTPLPETVASYQVFFVLVTTNPIQVTISHTEVVEQISKLESFSQTADSGIASLLSKIPFDASIVSRMGDTVILDRGAPPFLRGMRLTTYTIENTGRPLRYAETGSILLNRVDKDIAFGKVIEEKSAGEVAPGNKLRIDSPVLLAGDGTWPAKAGRSLASAEPELFATPHSNEFSGEYGFLQAGFGANMVNVDNRASADAAGNMGSVLYPTFSVASELWVTAKVFLDVGYDFSAGALGGNALVASSNSSYHAFNAQLGYRYHFFDPDSSSGPYLEAKMGYGNTAYVTGASQSSGYSDISYNGLLTSLGLGIPLNSSVGLGLGFSNLFFASVSENPSNSGRVTGATQMAFSLSGYYHLTSTLQLTGKFQLVGSGADFSSGPVGYSHQSGRSLGGALSYYF